jgi:FkbM family methyltransferase
MYAQNLLKALYKAFISPSKPKKSYSQFAEDLLIQLFLRDQVVEKFYVDVGCHHPRRGSNTFLLYQKNWNGLLVDLEKEKVLACQLARPRDKVILAAVSDKEELVDIYSPKKFSTNTTINVDGVVNKDGYVKIGEIQTRTLNSILDDNNVPKSFALLSIDVEGVDFQVLKSINLNEYRPRVICIECWESSDGIAAIIAGDIYQHLIKQGYELKAWLGLSTIFVRSFD